MEDRTVDGRARYLGYGVTVALASVMIGASPSFLSCLTPSWAWQCRSAAMQTGPAIGLVAVGIAVAVIGTWWVDRTRSDRTSIRVVRTFSMLAASWLVAIVVVDPLLTASM